MSDNDEYRLTLGKRADELGRILAQVGELYELRAAGSGPDAEPEFVSPDLAGIEQYLARVEQQG